VSGDDVPGLVEAAPGEVPVPAEAPNGVGPAIRCIGLTKRYGELFAVRDLNLEVKRGCIFGLIGPNGAGKSTTFSILASLLAPTAGSVEVAGFDPATHASEVRRRMGYMPDVLGLYDDLKVAEYLDFFAASYRVPAKARPALIDGLLDLVDLSGKREAMVDALSRGMKQRLSLARALVHDPEVLILDEPASRLDPRARVELRGLLHELRDMGKTVVISSHILAELEEICSEVAILEAGRLLADGSPRSIRDRLAGSRTIRVRLAGGEEQTHIVASEEEQQALLRRLVAEGLPVVEYTETGAGLEDLFMQVTKGIVQ
jgi:ABC-2 type transport system ATP-binding protein